MNYDEYERQALATEDPKIREVYRRGWLDAMRKVRAEFGLTREDSAEPIDLYNGVVAEADAAEHYINMLCQCPTNETQWIMVNNAFEAWEDARRA